MSKPKMDISNDDFSVVEKFGFDKWFQDRIDLGKISFCKAARVITVNKNSYVISNGKNEIYAELSGKMLFEAESSVDFPAVGDWVYVQIFDDDSLAIIQGIFPRRSVLKRKTAGKNVDYQLIAANVDTAVIMQALDFNFNLRRIERYLVMTNESNINPVIFLSKSDLLTPDEVEKKKDEIYKIFPEVTVVAFSNTDLSDIEKIKPYFHPAETFCLLGSSGVGKTTLLNNLVSKEQFKTGAIREKDGRGRHTTTSRELIVLDNGSIVIDNPGMRELGVISVESGLDDTFSEITELSSQCRYSDCTHTKEKGCAVLEALEKGTISQERYDSYMKIHKESLYNEMSYYEKRQKDKQFGKFMHNYKKNYGGKK